MRSQHRDRRQEENGSGHLSRAKRGAFWAFTLLVPPVLLLLGVEGLLRLASPDRVPIDGATLDERLQESAETEVAVVSTGNLRGLIAPSERPGVIYELKPSRRWVFQGAETATNSHGLRGPEIPVEKPAGVVRIAGLGDSVMFGWGVGQQETYVRRLEELLSNTHRQVQVLNFAVPGYNSAQEAATLSEKALAFSPNIILVNYCTNDWASPFFVIDPNLNRIVESSLLLQNIRQRLVPGVSEGFFDHYQGWDKMVAALGTIGAVARRQALPVLYFMYPRPDDPEHGERAKALARDNGFIYVDLATRFAHHVRERGYSGMEVLDVRPGDPHPNAEAHAIIADALAAAIEPLLGD